MSALFLYAIALTTAALGVVVFLRNSKSPLNRRFLALAISISTWIASNAAFGQALDDSIAYIIGLIAYFCAAITAVSFFFFVHELSTTKMRMPLIVKIGLVAFVLLSPVPGLLATRVVHKSIQTTPVILLYALCLSSLFVGGMYLLIRARFKVRGQQRQQLGTVLAGLAGGIIGGVFFNLVLPIYGNYQFVQLGPVFSSLFVLAAAYSIVRHRLFDVRAAIVRLVAYLFAIVSVAVLYAIVAYVIAVPLLGSVIGENSPWLYIGLAIVVSITFQPIKRFFDRATRAVFYKNAYESQHVFDVLATILVHESDVLRMVRRSMQLLSDTVKPTGVCAVLYHDHRLAQTIGVGRTPASLDQLVQMIRHKHIRFTVTDELAERGNQLYHDLSSANVAMIAPLVTSNATVGYLFIGYKVSGDAFTEQDINLVHIFSDELAVAVQNGLRFREIQRFNRTLESKVEEATFELRESNKKLQKLDEAKDDFISMASHQLRTPLTSVKGYLSMVLEGDAGDISADQRKLLEEAYGSAQRMVYLIGDFLNVSRLQTGKFSLEATPVNLAHVIREEIEQLQATASRRNIKLTYHEPANFPTAPLDDSKIRQVIMNFVDNAIFYSRPDGEVLVELIANAHEIVFTVHDNGIGVPAAERHHLFSKFYRASNARNVRPDGTGIGLYMAKKVIAAHGGSLIFESRENHGSTFGFTLPLKH